MFIKIGELIEINGIESVDSCTELYASAISSDIIESFKKTANNLKKVAPKAEDFLYFSAVMMHAAEASSLNDDGTPKLNAKGEVVQVGWDKSGGTLRWKSNDPNIKPYKNSNGDIFPEEELTKAFKKWVGKPLCIDHKSSSVDHVRGFIVDTYYDRALKRVIALCALDKAGYPQLARQVTSGVSNCVSMGTAVGKAICSDCATVARTEADFCDHMRRKSCYGEINIDLNPIELSIVVNGADPKANIKHIIAAAQNLNNYIEQKTTQLNKLAKMQFNASLSFNDNPGDAGGVANSAGNITLNADTLEGLKADVAKAFADFEKINAVGGNENLMSNDTNNVAFNQSSGTVAMDETAVPNTDSELAPPHARYASANINNADLHNILAPLVDKLELMKQSFDKLVLNTSLQIQEENMSGKNEMNKNAYYQGTEEPTPGQAKYPKDPLNEKLRTDGDKHMEGQSPFPQVGPVDGMHPSPDSSDQSNELERKKMLARAESDERAANRSSIVSMAKKALENKKAYFQGTEEPTPGKPQYAVDKLEYVLREKEDKHMNGQKPFPNVGPVDGMHPSPSSADVSDELKRKELLSRASLRGRFIKASNNDGSLNQGKSAWEIFLGDKLVLTASVNDISGNRADSFYPKVATKSFGMQLIEKVKAEGADKVRSILKSAQAAPPPPAPEAAPALPPAPEGDAPAEDTGASGDPKATAVELSEKVRDLSSDLVEAVRGLTGEQAEMGDAEMSAAASDNFGTGTLNTLRKELNSNLSEALKESVASLNGHKEELDMIIRICERGGNNGAANSELVGTIFDDALNAAKSALADGFKLMTAFVKYARGTKAIVKRAQIEAELESLAEGENMETDSNSADMGLMDLINDTNSDLDAMTDGTAEDHESLSGDDGLEGLDGLDGLESDDNDLMAKPEELKDLQVKPGTHVEVTASVNFDSKSGRAAMRAKLAAEALKTSPHLHEAHPQGGFTTDLDVKPTGNLAEVEDLEQIQDAMLDLANAPPKVRKEAEAIYKLVAEGKLDPQDLDALVAEGLDKDAVSYYKKYFAQVDGGSEFASELVKEHAKAQLEEELNKFRVKLARAYELAYDMVERDLCRNDRVAVSAQVDEIMKFNDDSFDSLKRVVARHAPVMQKSAGRMPNVGMIGSGEVNTTNNSSDEDIFSQLSAAFSKTSKRLF